jgi:hypothetical protein
MSREEKFLTPLKDQASLIFLKSGVFLSRKMA